MNYKLLFFLEYRHQLGVQLMLTSVIYSHEEWNVVYTEK